MAGEISRRRFLAGASLLPLAAAVPPRLVEWLEAAKAAAAAGGFAFFDDHQAAVVREATARLIPGPGDDASELGHPGAREANVVGFIDTMLGAFTFATPEIHAGGPWSNRNTGPTSPDFMTTFVPLTRMQTLAWKKRLAGFQQQYAAGIDRYDAAARSAGSSDFASAPPATQDSILMQDTSGFRDLLFTHAIEGMYAVPEYGGNAGTPPVGWQDVKFRGDTQPVGWSPAQVSNSDGPDPIVLDGVVQGLAAKFQDVAAVFAARWRRGG
jgi:hypothetical protein